MKTARRAILVALAGLLGLAAAGLVLTSSWVHPELKRIPGPSQAAAEAFLVDQQPLATAQHLATFVDTPEEQQLAAEALPLADQEVDLAFDSALREVAEHPTPLTPEGRRLQSRVAEGKARVAADQGEVAGLTKLAAKARGDQKESFEAQAQMAQARLELDQDELEDARRDLMRAGGDAQSRLHRLLDEHERSQTHANSNAPHAPNSAVSQAANANPNASSLIAAFRAWNELREKRELLRRAQQDAKDQGAKLTGSHDSLESEMKRKVSKKSAPAQPTAGASPAASGPVKAPVAAGSAMRQLGKDLADLDKRIETQQRLGDVYGKWSALVRNRELASLHRLIQSGFWIVLILLSVLLADYFTSRYFSGLTPDRKRLLTARAVIHFSVRAAGVVLILLVIFGPPNQLATILALAGAGLTVALKDFIVSFLGWFVLMGRNGVRPGDWVEINGVQGKVIEVGLLHTVLLEAGNWTAAGHPTGRKVTFTNSFAIEGHYFNFTTAGQWLWDEVQVGLPSNIDPYPLVEAIRKLVADETEADARLAEQEWRGATTTSGLRSFSATPTISVRPTETGVNVIVRYIARADERDDLRSRLYHAVFEFLIAKNVPQPPPPGDTPARQPAAERG